MSLRSVAPLIIRGWKIWAHLSGMAVIALMIGAGIVQAVSGRDAVITAGDVRNETKSAPYKGRYGYTYTLERHEACPGEVVVTFSTADTASPAVITLRRPAVLNEIKTYPEVKIDNPLPESVTAGVWDVATSLNSHCANREQNDPIAKFRLEVTS